MRTFFLALGLALAAPAFAGDTPKLDKMKEEVDYEKKRFSDVEKLAKDWHKADEKAEDLKPAHQALKEFYKDELARLRDLGVPTTDNDLPTHPQHPDMVLDAEPRDKLEALRDLVVALKSATPGENNKKYGKDLDAYVTALSDRVVRKEKQYEDEKAKAK